MRVLVTGAASVFVVVALAGCATTKDAAPTILTATAETKCGLPLAFRHARYRNVVLGHRFPRGAKLGAGVAPNCTSTPEPLAKRRIPLRGLLGIPLSRAVGDSRNPDVIWVREGACEGIHVVARLVACIEAT
jgi:hypothetical protein